MSSLPRLEVLRERPFTDPSRAAHESSRLRRNRKLILFFAVFAVTCLIGLAYTFARPPIYQSQATLLIEPVLAESSTDLAGSRQVAVERQILLGHPVLLAVTETLTKAGLPISEPVPTLPELRDMLAAEQLDETFMVELSAEGTRPMILPVLLNAWIDVYLEARDASQQTSSETTRLSLRDQLRALEEKIAQKRDALDRFRKQHDIVSLEPDDNQVVARLQGLNEALKLAEQEEVAAEARLAAVNEAIAQGKPVIHEADRAELASLERQATDLKAKLQEFEQRFTPAYMAIDPLIVALSRNLDLVEGELRRARQTSRQTAVSEAEQALASARRSASNLRSQLAAYKEQAADFTARFAEHEALQEDLAQLETLYRETQERLVQTEVAARDAFPSIAVLEQPLTPDAPVRPDYLRDAGLSLAAAALLGLLAVLLYEFFTRPARGQAPIPEEGWPRVLAFSSVRNFLGKQAPEALPGRPSVPALEQGHPREISIAEAKALLEAADDAGRLVAGLLLSGLTLDEVASLTGERIDPEDGFIHVPGDSARRLPLAPLLAEQLARSESDQLPTDQPLLRDVKGTALGVQELAASVTCAAHDAGLNRPGQVTPESLRHTYLAFLVRQGIRLADLKRVAGGLSPTALAAYGSLSPPIPGVALEQIELIYPALQETALTAQ